MGEKNNEYLQINKFLASWIDTEWFTQVPKSFAFWMASRHIIALHNPSVAIAVVDTTVCKSTSQTTTANNGMQRLTMTLKMSQSTCQYEAAHQTMLSTKLSNQLRQKIGAIYGKTPFNVSKHQSYHKQHTVLWILQEYPFVESLITWHHDVSKILIFPNTGAPI